MKKERATTSDEQRERMLIAEQIERAREEAEGSGSQEDTPPVELGLKRDDPTEKVVLSFAPKAPSPPSEGASSSGLKLNPLKPRINPLKPSINPLKAGVNPLKAGNALKRPNVFKQAASSVASGSDTLAGKKRDAAGATEGSTLESQERKRFKIDGQTA